MKLRLYVLSVLLFVCCYTAKSQYVTIPDGQFVNWLTNNYPSCMSGNQLDISCPAVLNAHVVNCSNNYIANLEGIQYFTSLDSLYCGTGNLSSIPSFPTTLTLLDLHNNQLPSIPALPSGLVQLSLNNNWLTSIPALPSTLISFDCFGNQITSLPALPASLKVLSCEVNQLTSIPTLPDSLIVLGVSVNPLGSLPTLPSQLYQLYCGNCQLTQLPPLPSTLTILDATNNMLTSIPPLPPVMWDLNVSMNPSLACLPPVLEVNDYINISNTAITCLPNIIQHPGSWPQIDTLPLCGLYGSGCQVAWNVMGHAFLDANNNCIDDGESSLQHIKAMLYHNGTLTQQVYTNAPGTYSFDTDLSGGYSVSMDTANVPFNVTCPVGNLYNANITASDSLDTVGDFGLTCNAGYDLGVEAIVRTAGLFFPNDTATINIFAGDMAGYYGATCNTGGVSGTVQLTFSGPVIYAGSNGLVAPTSVSGNTIIWQVNDFSQVDFYQAFRVKFLTDMFASIGQYVCIEVTVAPNADGNPYNNTSAHCFMVTNSYDPNIKEASPIATVTPGGWISYTVYFQNTGNAAAHNILVTDQLDANLDWSTFQLTGTSHEAVTQVIENGLVKFTFFNIMLPDSNTNEPESHGWIQYRIKANDNLAVNTTIDNSASIYFDFNDPVITNTTHNTYEINSVDNTSTKSFELNVYPNPASQFVTIDCSSLDNSRIVITDVTGREVLRKEISNSNHVKFALDELANGIYNVQLLQQEHVLASQKLAVIR